jgi:four helix bundle protein
MAVMDVKELTVYIKAYRVAMEFFELSKGFPAEERYALTSQGRRSSRSVCHNLREAWAKRRYEAHFVSKLSDCIGENWKLTRQSILPVTAATSASMCMHCSRP